MFLYKFPNICQVSILKAAKIFVQLEKYLTEKTVKSPFWQKHLARKISWQLILVTNQKFSHFISVFYR